MEEIPKTKEKSPASGSSFKESEIQTEKGKIESELQAEKDKSENNPAKDAELDIKSEHFNPLKLLYEPGYRVTKKQPRVIYQNMAAFETAVKKVGIMGLNRPRETQPSGSKDNKKIAIVKEEKIQRRFQDYQISNKTQSKVKGRHQRNILIQMAQSEGPLRKLQEYVNEVRTVKVFIRRESGIKGYVEGVLKMFDRHWNLFLVNVTESLEGRKYKYVEDKLIIHQIPQDCSELLQKLGITLPKESVKSLGRKRVEIKRRFPQILLRGEHVVLIQSRAPE